MPISVRACHPLQLQKLRQQFVRIDNVATTVSAVGIDYPAPTGLQRYNSPTTRR